MKIEQQVCNLEQAKRLDSLGIIYKDVMFKWVSFTTYSGEDFALCREASSIEESSKEWAWFIVGDVSKELRAELDEGSLNACGGIYAAFTVGELSEMLPTHITWEDDQYFFQIIRGSKRWLAEWHTNKKDLAILSDGELDRPRGVLWNTYKGNKFLVNVFADWVIALLENKVINVEDVNQWITHK